MGACEDCDRPHGSRGDGNVTIAKDQQRKSDNELGHCVVELPVPHREIAIVLHVDRN